MGGMAFFSFCACSHDEGTDAQTISFLPVGTQTTRATTTASISTFGVSCSAYPSNSTFTSAGCGSYFFNERIDASTGRCNYFWPGASYKVSFFAYAPYGNGAFTLSSARTQTGYPVYSYTVPETVGNQLDVMTAEVLNRSGASTNSPVALNFGHRLVDIRFNVTNQNPSSPLTVQTITLTGMKYVGTLTSTAWTLTGSVNSLSSHPFTFTPNRSIAANATVDVTGTTGHFMVIPQTITSGTTFITIKTTESGSEHTYTHALTQNMVLQQGKSYTFNLTLGDGTLIVDPATAVNDWMVEQRNISGYVGTNDWL